jgi:endoglucanase
VIEGLATASPSGPWKKMAAGLPKFLAASAPAGFATDWSAYTPQAGIVPAMSPVAPPSEPVGSYDAIRTYLWAGMTDRQANGARASLSALHGMADYLDHQPTPPEKVTAKGKVISDSSAVGFSAALMPYLSAMGREGALSTQRQRLEAQRDQATGLYGKDPKYFDQNLAMFGVGWTEKRFRFERDGTLKVKWN